MMDPVKGHRKPRKCQKKNDENGSAAAFGSSQGEEPADWWDEFSKRINGRHQQTPSSSLDHFRPFFEITRSMFEYICSLVEEDMMGKSPHYKFTNGMPMSLHDQVAVALRRLGSGDKLAIISGVFGLSPPIVSDVTWRFVQSMAKKGFHLLAWPSTEQEMNEIKSKFEKLLGLPNCCGVVDVTHINMTVPSSGSSKDMWLDNENKHSMVLQAIVDPDMRFRAITTGWPGCLEDWMVFENSTFHRLCNEGEVLNGRTCYLPDELEIREYIIGDSGFPLLPYLIVPYKERNEQDLTASQADFNRRHFETRMVAQRALVKLKETWRIIQGTMWRPDIHKLPTVILVCCILHNIVIDMENKVQDEPSLPINHDLGYCQLICEKAQDMEGEILRENMSLYLSEMMSP